MTRLLFLALCLSGLAASAQTVLPCAGSCPDRYYFESQPCSSGTCSRSYAPLPSEFVGGVGVLAKGMSLAAYEGVQVTVCAAPGYTLSGTGTLRWWVWEPWLPNDVSSTPSFDLNMADAERGEECSYTTQTDGGVVSGVGAGDGGTNLSYRCRCTRFTDYKVAGFSSRRLMLQAVGVTTSAEDDSYLEVRLVGLGVVR